MPISTHWVEHSQTARERELIARRGRVWPEKRLLVCGPTDYRQWDIVKAVLQTHRPTTIIHGHASGVDHLASLYAQLFRIDELRFPAQWRTHGVTAPLVRNELMFKDGKPDLVLTFPGGFNCADIHRLAGRHQIRVISVNDADWSESATPERLEPRRVRA